MEFSSSQCVFKLISVHRQPGTGNRSLRVMRVQEVLKGQKEICLDSWGAAETVPNINSMSWCSPPPAAQTPAMPSPGSTLDLGTASALRTATLLQTFSSDCTQLLLQNTRCDQGCCPRKEERFSCLVCVCWEGALFSHSFCSFSLIIWNPDLWVHSFNSVYTILIYYFNLCCCWGNLASKDHGLFSVTHNSSRKHSLVWRGLWVWLGVGGGCLFVCLFVFGVCFVCFFLGWFGGFCKFWVGGFFFFFSSVCFHKAFLAWVVVMWFCTGSAVGLNYLLFFFTWVKKSEKPGEAFQLQVVGLDF